MPMLKTVLTFMLVGALLGNVVASLVAPSYLAWNNSAPQAAQTICNLPQVIQNTSSDLIKAQLTGSGIGAVILLVVGIVFVRARAKKEKQQATPPPAPPAPTAA